MQCPSCGAPIRFEDDEVVTECGHCGSQIAPTRYLDRGALGGKPRVDVRVVDLSGVRKALSPGRAIGCVVAMLVLIGILVVGWFKSFSVPLAILLPIPLSLVGILPAHAVAGAFFTATSLIGFIAGAGIIVRNSIILVDFIELKVREGMALEEAVIEAGVVRFRPMLLTAAAVTAGSLVMLLDPIFQGLSISLMAGEIAATLLSRVAVPVVYYLVARRSSDRALAAEETEDSLSMQMLPGRS